MASMTINSMREYILAEYPKARPMWRNMIATTNNTAQIVAIYHRIENKKAADSKAALEKEKSIAEGKPDEEYHQIDMFEYLATLNKKGNTTKIEV